VSKEFLAFCREECYNERVPLRVRSVTSGGFRINQSLDLELDLSLDLIRFFSRLADSFRMTVGIRDSSISFKKVSIRMMSPMCNVILSRTKCNERSFYLGFRFRVNNCLDLDLLRLFSRPPVASLIRMTNKRKDSSVGFVPHPRSE